MTIPQAFVGRQQASLVLRSAVRRAYDGHGSLVLVTGDAGIGKTALVSHVAAGAREWVAAVAWGRAVEALSSPAYWMWTQVLRQLGVLPEGGHLGDVAHGARDDGVDRFGLFEQVVAALDDASRSGGLLVVLDDLHWADPDSLALLDLVGRSLSGRRIALLGTYRGAEASESVQRLARSASVVTLEGLPLSVIAELMRQVTGADVSAEDAARMQRRTGGNPFFVRELTRLSQLRSDSGQPWGTVEVVASVRDVLERRLARLSQPCARMLVTASLDGVVVRPWVLRAVHDAADVSAVVEEATAQRILATEPGTVRFSHDLFREVIAVGLSASARLQTHLALARVLASGRQAGRPVHASELAHHFAAAATPGDAETLAQALRYAREAARESELRLAFDDAAAHLERARDALETTGAEPGARLELLLELAAAQQTAGQPAQAAGTFREAWSLARTVNDPIGQAHAVLGLHAVGTKTGPSAERDRLVAMLEEAIEAVELVDPLVVSKLRAALAGALYHSLETGRMDRARAVATTNVSAARRLGDHDSLVSALRALHDVSWSPGTAHQRLVLLDELDHLLGTDDLGLRLLRAQALLELADPASRVLVSTVCEEAELTGRPGALWLAASRRAALALLAGRLDEALLRIEEAERIAERIGDDDARWITDIQRWELARFAGGRGAYERRRPDGEPKVEHWPPWRSIVLGDAGRHDEAANALRGFTAAEAHGPGVDAGYDLWFPAIAAEAACRHGSDRLRADLYDLLAPHSGTQVGCGAWVAYCGPVDGYLADLAYALGDSARGSDHLLRAQEQCLRLDAPLWLRRVRASQHQHGMAAETNTFTRNGAVWSLSYQGVQTIVPDAKGLHDIAVLLTRPHESVAAATLAGTSVPDRGEPVLDRRAAISYRARIDELAQEIDDADTDHDLDRATRARRERDALLDELRRATGRGGRPRRLGDDSERVRKMVRARVHRALLLVADHHPDLAAHLQASIETGHWCTYRPAQPLTWRVIT
jgi:tetratricopeptide (TPR) repeat protein